MDEQQSILKQYYRGETTIREELELKKRFKEGELRDHPTLAFQPTNEECPAFIRENIRTAIGKCRKGVVRQWIVTASSIAAVVVLIISLRGTLHLSTTRDIQLSNNLKKERFEDALRVIGNAIESKPTTNEKILYEDSNIIITIE